MLDALYKRFAAVKNLELAWKRLHTSQNIFYKNHYRNIFWAYEISAEKNIRDLSERLKGGAYTPSDVLKFYLPKPSGLQRPITFLHIEDLIVYQALVNIVAFKLSDKREEIENNYVFSNLLNRDGTKDLFFLKKWQEGYQRFHGKIKRLFKEKYFWVSHFDLAAYYDTIDHDVLLNQISPKKAFPNFTDQLQDCLNKWSTHSNPKLSHGIPQGPNASDYIAELYFLPIDLKLVKKGVNYVRYVDDIKIFGKSERDVQEGIIYLEELCKERGLIPQSKKYSTLKAEKIEEALGKMPSLTSREKIFIFQSEKEAYKLFKDAFPGKEGKVDYTKVKYILKASHRNGDILKDLLPNINKYPTLIDEFCTFLERYKLEKEIGEYLFNTYIENSPSPYPYVEGRLWELLSTFPNLENREKKVSHACERIKKSKNSFCLKKGLYLFLCSTENNLILKWIVNEKSSLIQAMIIPFIPNNCFIETSEMKNFIEKCFQRSSLEPAIVLTKQLLSMKAEFLVDSKLISKSKSTVVRNTFKALSDIHEEASNIDPIGEIISRRYNVPEWTKWKSILGAEYKHANMTLFLAERAFYIERNAWVNIQDSFNDILIRRFFISYEKKNPKCGFPPVIDKNNKTMDFGALLDPKNKFSTTFPLIQDGFYRFHCVRIKTPASHAYDKKTGKKSSFVTSQQKNQAVGWLRKSYSEYIKEVQKIC